MADQTIKITDQLQNVIAVARVSWREDHFSGQIDSSMMPEDLRKKFEEFENLVNGQMFALLNEIEGQNESLLLRVILESGQEIAVEDLQVYPTSERVSFRPRNKETLLTDNGSTEARDRAGFHPLAELG
jgi:hypothetical protein